MTTLAEDPNVAKFEREAERNRAELSQTVGELREKISDTVSPAAVKREVKEYVQHSGEQLIETIRRKAYENPLQAIAVAAGIGYPLWRMFANVPVPVLMVGAGIALARPGAADRVGKSGTPPITDAVHGVTGAIHHGAEKASDMMTGAADQVTSSVKGAPESVQAGIGEVAGSVVQAAHSSADKALETVDRYPFVVGAIGLSIGALLGAAIPRTSAETELVGELSEDVQDRAREMMSRGVQAAKGAASEVYDTVAQEANKQGLTGEKMRESARELKDQVVARVSEKSSKGSSE